MGEALLLWSAAFVVVAGIVLPYAVSFRRRRRLDAERKEEASALGIDRPQAQFPFVDRLLCIGCGACVDECPEGDVLGVVAGTATVINGLRCVGHARCEVACPVGAIQVGTGDLRSREDVPQADRFGESDVPLLFVAGEVTGLALVRNATAQGVAAVDRIAARLPSVEREPGALDVLIVGAGPAGIAAALAATARGLSYLVLEQEPSLGGSILHYPRRKLVLLQPLELPLAPKLRAEEHPKEELLAFFEQQVERFGLHVVYGSRVSAITREEGAFTVTTPRARHRARAVLLAVGRRGSPRKLGVKGEELPKVMYRLIDAGGYRSSRVLVVGGGDSAVEAAIGLAREGRNEVTLSYRRDKLVRIKKKNEERLAPLLARGQVRTALGSQVVEIEPERVRLKLAPGEETIDNDYVFVFAGGEPPFPLLRAAGVRFGGQASAA